MNQILVHEKVIVTPEFKRKKKIYKMNFFLSVFLACTLFSCYIYAEYDRNKSEEVSHEILSELQEIEENAEDNTTISLEEDVLVVKMLADGNSAGEDDNNEVSITDMIQQAAAPKIIESTANDGTKYNTESI